MSETLHFLHFTQQETWNIALNELITVFSFKYILKLYWMKLSILRNRKQIEAFPSYFKYNNAQKDYHSSTSGIFSKGGERQNMW